MLHLDSFSMRLFLLWVFRIDCFLLFFSFPSFEVDSTLDLLSIGNLPGDIYVPPIAPILLIVNVGVVISASVKLPLRAYKDKDNLQEEKKIISKDEFIF